MTSQRGAAGVVQCHPWASSAVGAVATGAEFPPASEGGARCTSRNTCEGFCRSPPFSAEFRWRPSSQEWSSSHSRRDYGACTSSCNAVGVRHAIIGCRRSRVGSSPRSSQEGQSTSVCATSCRPGFCFQDVVGQKEETFGGSRAGNSGGHQASRRSQSRGRCRGGKTFRVESRSHQSGVSPIAGPHRCWCFRRDCPSEGQVGCRLGGTRCSFAEQPIEKTSHNAPNQWGSHTDGPHPSMPSLVPAELSQWLLDRQSDLQENLELGGPPDLVLQLTSMLSDGAVRMMEMNGGMVPLVRRSSNPGVSWRGTVSAGSGLGRHRTQVLHDDGVSLTLN